MVGKAINWCALFIGNISSFPFFHFSFSRNNLETEKKIFRRKHLPSFFTFLYTVQLNCQYICQIFKKKTTETTCYISDTDPTVGSAIVGSNTKLQTRINKYCLIYNCHTYVPTPYLAKMGTLS